MYSREILFVCLVLLFILGIFIMSFSETTTSTKPVHHPCSSMAMNRKEKTGNADLDFVNMMIPHHENAITMSKEYLADPEACDTRVKELAQNIINKQQQEIIWMKEIANEFS